MSENNKEEFVTHQIIPDESVYNTGVEFIKHTKDKRDEVNKFFISMFSITLSVMPFLSTITEKVNIPFGYTINIVAIIFSTLGIVLSILWILMLKHTMLLLHAAEGCLKQIELKNGFSFFNYISEFLERTSATGRVTRQEVYIAYAFLIIFLLILLVSTVYAILKI